MAYLDRLKALNSEKCSPSLLPKLPKAPSCTFGTIEGGRFQEKTETVTAPPLAPGDLEAVSKWLDAIKETDPAERARVLDKCRADPRALAYVLGELANLPSPPPPPPKSRPAAGFVRCADCTHFERTSHHPNLGHCAQGQPEAIAGLADLDLRWCGRFSRRLQVVSERAR